MMIRALRLVLRLSAILLVSFPLFAAEPTVQQLPVGTLLPVMLNNSINSDKSKPDQKISAKLQQDVPLPDRGVVKKGAEVFGHIVSIKRGTDTSSASVVFVFDRMRANGREYPITTRLQAMASMAAIFQAKQPINSTSPDTLSVWEWTTRQVGGDIVYTGQGKVESPAGVVGMVPEPGWVVAVPRANPDAGCDAPENKNIQAFWLFSTNACGVYGDDNLRISRDPSENATGEITLSAPKRVEVRDGSGLLLTVLPQVGAKP